MISIRRLIASILVGGLLVLVSAAQASAQAQPALDRALHGVGLGLAAVADVVGDADVLVVDESLLEAFDAYAAWLERHDSSDRRGIGQGPERAAEVHRALRAGEIPAHLDEVDGSRLGELAGVYDQLKGKSDEAKAAKEDKAKNDKAKNDAAKEGNARAEEAKDSPPGQNNRP